MQVTIHSIDRAEVKDFTPDHSRSTDSPPFVAVTLYDGKGSKVQMLLRDTSDLVKLGAVAMEALDIMGKLVTVS